MSDRRATRPLNPDAVRAANAAVAAETGGRPRELLLKVCGVVLGVGLRSTLTKMLLVRERLCMLGPSQIFVAVQGQVATRKPIFWKWSDQMLFIDPGQWGKSDAQDSQKADRHVR
jgi:hypothetical protein